MSEQALSFDDSAAYERFMGSWSRAAGPVFLEWLASPPAARWLEVGCGTGIFTQLISEGCSPATLVAVDSAPAQIDHARRQSSPAHPDFRIADAQALPFEDATFDIVVSALVINFISDPVRALSEMRRVSRADGLVAGYVWDFAAERSPSWPMRAGMRKFRMTVPDVPGTRASSLNALISLFEQAGFGEIVTRSIEVTNSCPDFDSFWRAQTPSYSPATKMIAAMPETDQQKLIETVRAGLPLSPDGRIEYSARANAIKARVP
jgi:ubiquinone/menaquinone biosynthesis C-methylase UbiE